MNNPNHPQCKQCESTQVSTVAVSYTQRHYKCLRCGHRWQDGNGTRPQRSKKGRLAGKKGKRT